MRRVLLIALLALSEGDPAAAGQRLTDRAFGAALIVEAHGETASEAALREGVAAVREVEGWLADEAGALAGLNAAAGRGPQPLPAALREALSRAHSFCDWSGGAHGVLGGPLHALWGLRQPVPQLPAGEPLHQAIAAARCDQLAIDAGEGRVTLAAGAAVDLWSFRRGLAVDRALARLRERGLSNLSVTLGGVQRAAGPGPDGTGWPLAITLPADLQPLAAALRLRDRSVALATRDDGALRAAGTTLAPYLDQRRGQPVSGVLATLAASALALDAEGVAVAAYVIGAQRAGLLLGQLQPRPAVLWLLGSGEGAPLVADFHWGSALRGGGP